MRNCFEKFERRVRTAHLWVAPKAGEDAYPTELFMFMGEPQAQERLLPKVIRRVRSAHRNIAMAAVSEKVSFQVALTYRPSAAILPSPAAS
jgi:hypothetical protein